MRVRVRVRVRVRTHRAGGVRLYSVSDDSTWQHPAGEHEGNDKVKGEGENEVKTCSSRLWLVWLCRRLPLVQLKASSQARSVVVKGRNTILPNSCRSGYSSTKSSREVR